MSPYAPTHQLTKSTLSNIPTFICLQNAQHQLLVIVAFSDKHGAYRCFSSKTSFAAILRLGPETQLRPLFE